MLRYDKKSRSMTKIIIIFISLVLIVITNSCSVSLSTPRISELIEIEERNLQPFNPSENKSVILNKILLQALNDLNLPRGYAKLMVIETGLPAMYAGVGKNIYVSRSLIINIFNGDMIENQVKLLFVHELLHKIKNHPYVTLSNVTFKSEYENPIDVAGKLGISSLVYQRKSSSVNTSYDYYKLYSSPIDTLFGRAGKNKFEYTPRYIGKNKVKLFPLLGYIYSEKLEFEVDDSVLKVLSQRGLDSSSYIKSLQALKENIKSASKDIDKIDVSHLNQRILRLRKKERVYD